MFYSLTGEVIDFDDSSIAIECSGVGFKCNTSMNTLKRTGKKGDKITLYTYLSVREDALELYGFHSLQELEMFKLLISVSGIGPKVAVSVLSEFTPDALSLCIASGDHKSITRAQGVGAKTAQRICMELKDKVTSQSFSFGGDPQELAAVSCVNDNENVSNAVSALVALGYMQAEASRAVCSLDPNLSTQELIKQALRILAKGVG
ncbi:MAG: Holliday junction branch migration protein RuvA [Clostridiales bacterium]|jgi:Holliday junction DNA helicase RuvA|nr:Holliday junction branch migration protein RuvA [Clostridiales bacterium]HOA33130.1 Holliday junction branch migration protein RuvA [Clostridiales bacterium]HPP68853.1 Holliday junction branch migration protein RuvA [Clostridiales bacterium]HPU67287.1 Holliday junction branch migration protein RuvA [Clostridiales bacterium]HQA05600.1 Holliday junction branch migration protein RuvA [Clostridiales bacterium]